VNLLWTFLTLLSIIGECNCRSANRFSEPLAIRLHATVHPFAPSIVTVIPTPAITTVSRFFSDRHSGAAAERVDSSEESSPRRHRSLLQRLHIQTSLNRGKSPTPLRPPTAPAAISGGSSSVTAVRGSPSQSDAATIEEITRIMPQSLVVSTPPQGNPTKRQRSADGRIPYPRSISAGRNGSNVASSGTSRTPLKANVRIPGYLEKSKTGK